jgi:tRNA modification GTPase
MLAHAPTTRSAGILLDQANGAWERCIADADLARLARLNELVPLGRHLVEPWRIVIAGAPNVGKSSLLNALAGYTRSIIAPSPGTTRDLVSVRLAIDGWPVEVTDTAGIRAAPGELEQQGIERALAAARDADLRFWVLDGAVDPVHPEQPDAWHFVINKIDLPPRWDWHNVPGATRVSAQTRDGIGEWCARISHLLAPHPPAPGEVVPCMPAQYAWLAERVKAAR